MRRIALSFLIILIIAIYNLASAATFYVDNSCGTNGDGTTTTCGATGPFNSLINSQDCTGMSSGDTLEIRNGDGIYRESSWNLDSNCNGITLTNYSGEIFTQEGTTEISGSTWTDRTGGVYECTAGTCGTGGKQFPYRIWYDIGAGEEELNLIQTNTTCDSSLAAGFMRYDPVAEQVCVHLSDGSDPSLANSIYIPTNGSGLNLRTHSVTNVTIKVNDAGGDFVLQRNKRYGLNVSPSNTGLIVDGITIREVMDRCFAMSDFSGAAAAGIIVRNTTIDECGQEGLRCELDTAGCKFYNNTITNIQTSPVFEFCDGVGSGCQAGFSDNGTPIRCAASDGCEIYNNVINAAGGGNKGEARGINLEFDSPNGQVYKNLIYNIHGAGSRSGKAIIWSGGDGDNVAGAQIYNNKIFDVDICFGSSNGGTFGPGAITVEHNTCVNFDENGLAVAFGTDTHTLVFRNNILLAEDAEPSGLMINIPSSATNFQIPTYNALYCPTCTTNGNIVSWKGTTYSRDGDCTLGTDCLLDLSNTNKYGDPNIVTAGSPPTMKISSAVGSAVDAGTQQTVLVDFEAIRRPKAYAVDIGAHELDYCY